MNVKNSLSGLVQQFLQMNQNAIETFERINEAITSDSKTVKIDLLKENNSIKTVEIPSFGYITRELKRLDDTVKSLSAMGDGAASVKLADGTYRTLIKSKIKTAAQPVTSLNLPTRFETQSNLFFESFLSPLLKIKFDVSGQITEDTERVLVKKYLISSSNTAIDFFNTYKGSENINHGLFLDALTSSNIPYELDEEVLQMPYRDLSYYGDFSVISTSVVQQSVQVNGTVETKSVKLYTLNKLTYSDSAKTLQETETLKKGDELIVNSGKDTTKYSVVSINPGTLQVELQLVEGYEGIKAGKGQLKIHKAANIPVEIDVNIGFDQRLLVFIKPIDPDSNIVAEKWSPGIALETNELKMTGTDGTIMTLADYYQAEVADFGQFIKALQNDRIPASIEAVLPAAPDLISTNFKVVQINTHLTNNDTFTAVQQMSADKVNVVDKLKKLDDTIMAKKATLAVTKFKSDTEKSKFVNEIGSLSDQRLSETKLYSSLVTQIATAAQDASIKKISPKYRVRGFWSIPEAASTTGVKPQEIVRFIVQYRYLSTNGKTSNIDQIEFKDKDNTKTAAFSNWNEVLGPVRKRSKDADGKFYWVYDSEEGADTVNFNSLDIAIQPGEQVQFRIKSQSEAGWPSNPAESDYSEIITVNFPEGQISTMDAITIVENNEKEIAKVEISNELESRGVYKHVSDSFTANEKFFAHQAATIASGFLTPEQKPVSLFDKLSEMTTQVLTLQETLAGIKGELAVELVDETGNVTRIRPNTVNKIFAGYYTDQIKGLQVQKGVVITKNFKLLLKNTRATTLELVARITGTRTLPVWHSSASGLFGTNPTATSIDSRVLNDTYYTTEGKYDRVPIQYQNLDANTLLLTNNGIKYFQNIPYQSAQLRGQYIYGRYYNVSGEEPLYLETEVGNTIAPTTPITTLATAEFQSPAAAIAPATNAGTDFIWSGAWSAIVSGARTLLTVSQLPNTNITNALYDAGLYTHVDHPVVQDGKTNTAYTIATVRNFVSNTKTATLKAEEANGKKQTPYLWLSASNRAVKTSFGIYDQYLLGGKSCGSYLFLNPINKDSLIVDGDNKFGRKRIAGGTSGNAISIDITFQYRMTDYYGQGTTGTGRVGGIITSTLTNLTYAKQIGIDIFDADDEQFSFDLEVFAKYKAEGKSIQSTATSQSTFIFNNNNYNAAITSE
jgi:hypothetical protein